MEVFVCDLVHYSFNRIDNKGMKEIYRIIQGGYAFVCSFSSCTTF